jgi:uncharacterized protein YkwD
MVVLFLLFALAGPDARDREIVEELNQLRSNPSGYASYLQERLRYFQGKVLRLPGRTPLQTVEGAAAVQEAIRALRTLKPIPVLKPASGLSLAARDHVRDIGPKGLVQHDGLA